MGDHEPAFRAVLVLQGTIKPRDFLKDSLSYMITHKMVRCELRKLVREVKSHKRQGSYVTMRDLLIWGWPRCLLRYFY